MPGAYPYWAAMDRNTLDLACCGAVLLTEDNLVVHVDLQRARQLRGVTDCRQGSLAGISGGALCYYLSGAPL